MREKDDGQYVPREIEIGKMGDLFGNTKPRVANELLAVYDAEFRRRFRVPAPIVGKKDGPLAARLISRYEFEDLSRWVERFFAVPDPFIQQSGFPFAVFSACLAKVIAYDRRVQAQTTVQPRPAPSKNFLDVQRQVHDEWRSR